MGGWRISTVKQDDLEPILAIEKCSFQCPWSRISFEGELSCRYGFSFAVKSIETDGKEQIIGYAFMRRICEELHVLKIAVAPICRGRGVASWILNRSFTTAARRGASSAHLEVRASNAPAVALYDKLGFKVVGRRPNYYAYAKEDALMMSKLL